MRKLIGLILIFFSLQSQGSDSIHLKGHFFEGDKDNVTFIEGNEVSKFEKKAFLLPARERREQVFQLADLTQEVQGMDEVDRDLLFYKLKEHSLEDFKKEFPRIDIKKIKKAKAFVSK